MSRPLPLQNEVGIKTYPTPGWGSVVDELLIEKVEYNKPGYVRAREGSAHPNVREFPNHRLVKIELDEGYGLEKRYYCNGYRNEDQYNYDISYSGESSSHIIFSRRYKVRRDEYTAATKGGTFSGVYLIKVTAQGSGYDPKIPPTVTISGGGGSGATAVAIVSQDGKVVWVYLTSEGTGYTSTPSVSFSGGGGATATAFTALGVNVVGSILISNQGTGYTSAPSVSFSGSGGAVAVAQVSGGKVKSINVTSYGSYTSTPSVILTGGGGSGAIATASMETVTPYLVEEKVQQFPEDDPRFSLYLLVLRTYEGLPGPILVDHQFDPYIDQTIRIEKRIVLATQVPGDMTYVTPVEGRITEYQMLSRYRAIQIVSKVNTDLAWENGGDDFVYYGTANFAFPNEIRENPVYRGISAISGDNLAVDLELTYNVIEGYSGPCKARFTTRYTFDPEDAAFQADLPVVTVINPQAHVIYGEFGYSGGNLIAQVFAFQLPSSLHPTLTPVIPGVPAGASSSFTETIPATTPSSLPSGTWVVASVKPERFRYGLWIFNIVEVQVP